jgi:hypothetical protein
MAAIVPTRWCSSSDEAGHTPNNTSRRDIEPLPPKALASPIVDWCGQVGRDGAPTTPPERAPRSHRAPEDGQDPGSDTGLTSTVVTPPSALFHLVKGLRQQGLLALAREQTVSLFAFEIAQQIDEVVLRPRQP